MKDQMNQLKMFRGGAFSDELFLLFFFESSEFFRVFNIYMIRIHFLGPGRYSHIVLKGTNSRSLPSAWPDNMLCSCTETHRQTTESFLESVTFLDNKVARAELCTRSLALSHRCCSGPLLALRFPSTSTCAASILAARAWHSQTLQGRADRCMRQLLCDHTTVLDTIRNHMPIEVNEARARRKPPQQLEAHCRP